MNVVNGAIPVLTLVGSGLIQIASGSTYTELGATYTDAEDDASGSILTVTISGSVDTSTAASYTLTYNVTDTAGNAAIPITRNVNVLNGNAPEIYLSGSATVLHEQ